MNPGNPCRLLPALLLAASGALMHGATPEPAESQFRFGVHAGYGNSSGVDPGLGLGVRAIVGLGLADEEGGEQTALGALSAVASVDRFFPDCGRQDCSQWELNGNLVLPIFATRGFTPYLGAGLGFSRLSVEDDGTEGGAETDTEVGLNLLGGVRYTGMRLTTFGELRQNVGAGEDPFYVTVGVLFGG